MSDFRDKITHAVPSPTREPTSDGPHDESEMRVAFTLNLEDYAALLRYCTKLSPRARWRRRCRFAVGLGVGLLFLGVWGGLALAEEAAWGRVVGDLGSLLAVFLVLFPLFLLLQKYETYRALQALRRDPRSFEPTEMTLSAEHLVSAGCSSSLRLAWHALQEIVEHGECVFFFTAETEALILPRRAFADDQLAQAFIDTARRYQEEARRFVLPEGQA
jgi:hypothetical protein